MYTNQPSLKCQFDGHHHSPIIGVCVNKECQNKRPFCAACQYQFHNTHMNDLKSYSEIRNWFSQNSQIVEELKNYQNVLNSLNKKIQAILLQANNNQYNFYEMNFTDLHDIIDKQFILWNEQTNIHNLLQEMFSTMMTNKIKFICSQQQYSNNINKEDLKQELKPYKTQLQTAINPPQQRQKDTQLPFVSVQKYQEINQASQEYKGQTNPTQTSKEINIFSEETIRAMREDYERARYRTGNDEMCSQCFKSCEVLTFEPDPYSQQ